MRAEAKNEIEKQHGDARVAPRPCPWRRELLAGTALPTARKAASSRFRAILTVVGAATSVICKYATARLPAAARACSTRAAALGSDGFATSTIASVAGSFWSR